MTSPTDCVRMESKTIFRETQMVLRNLQNSSRRSLCCVRMSTVTIMVSAYRLQPFHDR